MNRICVWTAAVLLAWAPLAWAEDDPPKPPDGEAAAIKTDVVRGILVEVGPKVLSLKHDQRVINVALPDPMTDPLEAFLKAHLQRLVALKVRHDGDRLILVGPPGEEQPRPEGGDGAVIRGVLQQVRDRDIILKVGDGEGKLILIEIALPEQVGPDLAEFLKKRLNETVALRCRKTDHGLVLIGPAEMPRPPRPEGGEGDRPRRPDGVGMTREQAEKIEAAEREARSLAEQIRESDDTEKRMQLTNQLRKLLADLFELREAPKRQQLDRLRAEVERLARILKARAENKDQILERRLNELIGPPTVGDELHW